MVLVLRLHTPVSKGGFVTDAFKIMLSHAHILNSTLEKNQTCVFSKLTADKEIDIRNVSLSIKRKSERSYNVKNHDLPLCVLLNFPYALFWTFLMRYFELALCVLLNFPNAFFWTCIMRSFELSLCFMYTVVCVHFVCIVFLYAVHWRNSFLFTAYIQTLHCRYSFQL